MGFASEGASDLGYCWYRTALLALSPAYSAEGSTRLPREIPRPAKSKAARVTCACGVGSGSWVTFPDHPWQTLNHDADKKDTSFHFRYLMDDVAHEILIGHAGQLQVYGNVRGDIGDGGHSLQGDRKMKSPTLNHTAINPTSGRTDTQTTGAGHREGRPAVPQAMSPKEKVDLVWLLWARRRKLPLGLPTTDAA